MQTLKIGHYRMGPEPLGGFNTGLATTIARSRAAKKYLGKEYVVGNELGVVYHLKDQIRLAMLSKPTKVKFYKSASAAFLDFNKRVKAKKLSISKDVATVKVLKQKAQRGDIGAALELGDYGE